MFEKNTLRTAMLLPLFLANTLSAQLNPQTGQKGWTPWKVDSRMNPDDAVVTQDNDRPALMYYIFQAEDEKSDMFEKMVMPSVRRNNPQATRPIYDYKGNNLQVVLRFAPDGNGILGDAGDTLEDVAVSVIGSQNSRMDVKEFKKSGLVATDIGNGGYSESIGRFRFNQLLQKTTGIQPQHLLLRQHID